MKQTTDITHYNKVNRTQGSEVYIVTCELITPFSLQYHFWHWINFSIKLRPSESALSMCWGIVKTSPDVTCHHRFWRAHRPKRDKNSEADRSPPASLSLAKPFNYIPTATSNVCLFPYLATDLFLRLNIKVQPSNLMIWLHCLTCPIRIYQVILA